MCEEFGFDSGFETIDFDDGGDAEIEMLDFDDGGDAEIEMLDFDDGGDAGIETLDFDDSGDAEIEMLDFDDGGDTGIETLDFDDGGDTGIETLDFDDGGDAEIETLDFDDSGDTGIETLDFDDGEDAEIETLDSCNDENTEIDSLDIENNNDIYEEPLVDNDSENYDLSNESEVYGDTDLDDSDISQITDDSPYNNEYYYRDLPTDIDDFVDFEQDLGEGYEDLIRDIRSDDSLTPEQQDALIQQAVNDAPYFNNEDSYEDADVEDVGPVKVLTRDPQELISAGNDAINDRLYVQEQQYRSDGLSESEIQDRIAQDRVDFQNEFLQDAFPGQDVSPDVFNNINLNENSDITGGNSSLVDSDDIGIVSDVDNWISDINPNFDPFDRESPYCNNCGSCAYSVYQRLEGIDADACASAENIGFNSEMEALTGMEQVSMSPEDIESRLLEQGDGAHAIIGIDRADGVGHWFNAACIDGKVVAIDGQTGEIKDWPPDYGNVVNWEMSVKKGE